jgi:DNA polymerase-3 subunit gamma/tau
MPLHIEHRPKTFSEVFGNQGIKDSLESILDRKSDYPHAILFFGPTGCGKTTLARIVASILGDGGYSLQEYNMANLRGIDAVRQITEDCQYQGLGSGRRVYIFDEIHRQTKDAQNALLKVLEDPPSHVYMILCTTEPERLLPTLRGRCHSYQVKPLKPLEMLPFLRSILKKEKVEDYPDSILKEIASLSEGFPRNALVMLDAVIDMTDEKSALEALSSISSYEATTKELCQLITQGGTWPEASKLVKQLLAEEEPERIRQAILGYLTATLLGSKKNDRVALLINIFQDNIFYNGKSGITLMVYDAMKEK